jgi:hypothetical protein
VPGKAKSFGSGLISQSEAMFASLVASSLFLWIVIILSLADLRVWYNNLARIVREADVRVTLYKSDPLTANQPFLNDYSDLRESDGSAKEIIRLKLKMKNSSSPNTSSANKGYSSAVYSTSEAVTGDTAQDIDAGILKTEGNFELL